MRGSHRLSPDVYGQRHKSNLVSNTPCLELLYFGKEVPKCIARGAADAQQAWKCSYNADRTSRALGNDTSVRNTMCCIWPVRGTPGNAGKELGAKRQVDL